MLRPHAGLCVRSLASLPPSLRPSSGLSFLAANQAVGPFAGAEQHSLLAGRPAGSSSAPAEMVRSNVRRLVVTCPELLSWLLTAPRRPHSGAFPSRRENPGSPPFRPLRIRTESCQSLPTRIVKCHDLSLKGGGTLECKRLTCGGVLLPSSPPRPILLSEPRHPAPPALPSCSLFPILLPEPRSAPGVPWSCVLTHILLPKACSAPRAPSKATPSSQQIS